MMTVAEIRALRQELSRLEDLQLDKYEDKKVAKVGEVHKKIEKIRKQLAQFEGE